MEKIESAQMTKRTVAVYCGAGGKMSQEFKQKAFDLGSELAKNGFNLVTGGANVGMMKEVVDGHMQSDVSAQRHGVLPSIFRDFAIQHPAILPDNMLWPTDVHGRLKSFYNLADDIVVMPGGFGTLHELMDCLVHIQFDLITKRTFLVNLHNFWDPILEQFEVMVQQHAVQQKHVDNLIVVTSIAELIAELNLEAMSEMAQGIEAQRWDTGEV